MSKLIELGTRSDNGQPAFLDLMKLIETHIQIGAASGGGKSWTLRRILEQSFGKIPHLIFDPEGEFSTLRSQYEYVLVGAGGDIEANPDIAGELCRRLMELGASAVLDLYELPLHLRVRFVRLFLETLISLQRSLWRPTLVVIDEAHLFAPEKGAPVTDPQGNKEPSSLNAVTDLMVRGRKRGFIGCLATQRLAELSKTAGGAKTVLLGGTALDVDIDRTAKNLGFNSRADRLRIRKLQPGHFFAYGPAISQGEIIEVSVGPVFTPHPKAGEMAPPLPPTPGKIRTMLAKLADIHKTPEPAASSAASPALTDEIADLKRKLADAENRAQNAHGRGYAEGLKKASDAALERVRGVKNLAERIIATVDGISSDIKVDLDAQPTFSDAVRVANTVIADKLRRSIPPEVPLRFPRHDSSSTAQKILDAAKELEELGVKDPPRMQVAFMAGYTHPNSKGLVDAIGALRSDGHISTGNGTLSLTDIGRVIASSAGRPRTAKELQDRLVGMLGGASGKIVRELVNVYPNMIGRADLAARAGYGHVNSKGFAEAIGRLKSLGFIETGSGTVKAKPVLFLKK